MEGAKLGNEDAMGVGVGTVKPRQRNEHEIIGLEKNPPVRVVSPEYS